MKNLLLGLLVLTNLSSFASNREGGGVAIATAVYVDFVSFGSGIDTYTYGIADHMINNAKEEGKVRVYQATSTGFEGDIRLCVEFIRTDLSLAQNLVRILTPSIVEDREFSGPRTSLYLAMNCDSFENASKVEL